MLVNNSIVKLDPENVGVAFGILFLRGIQAKLHQQVWSICKNFTISSFAAAILESWMTLDLIGLHDFVAQPYLEKSHQSVSLNSKWFGNYSQESGLGVKLLPLSSYEG